MATNKSKKKKTKHNKIHKKISNHIKNKKHNKKNKKTNKGGDSILDTAVKSFMDNLFFYVAFIIGIFTIIGIIWYYVSSTENNTKIVEEEEDKTTQLISENIDPAQTAKAAQIGDETKHTDEYFQKIADGSSSIDPAISSTMTDNSINSQAESEIGKQVEINENVIVSPYKPSDNSISDPNPSNNIFKPSQNILNTQSAPTALFGDSPESKFGSELKAPKSESAPTALIGDLSESRFESTLNAPKLEPSLSSLSSVSSSNTFESAQELPEAESVSLPSKRLELSGARTLGGGNPYGPKKITIYKILGLLLLTLYLEHYKR